MIQSITVKELATRLQREDRGRLIDVREQDEWNRGHLPGAESIPLSEFESRIFNEVGKDEAVILYCHHGMRSEQAGKFLVKNGYHKVSHVQGGIDAWSVLVDPSIKRY